MGERKLIVDQLKFSYEGLFSTSELYSLVSSWFYEKGWDWYEKINHESVTPEGRQIHLVLQPWKNVSDFYKLQMRITINFIDVKEIEVQHNQQSLTLNQGLVRITFDGYVVSDRFNEWSKKAGYWFLAILAQRYFHRDHFEKMETWIKSDIDDLYQKIKNYLNVFKYTYQR